MNMSMETALFGLGNFWQPAYEFAKTPGVLHTSVGYTGGTSSRPTYHDMGDHVEAVQIDFDPHTLTYEDLLDMFWQLHHPEEHPSSTIFYFDQAQKALAYASKKHIELTNDRPTNILPAGKFYPAESYHQNYIAKLRREL